MVTNGNLVGGPSRDRVPVAVLNRSKVAGHPALIANFHGTVDTATRVRYRGDTWTGVRLAARWRRWSIGCKRNLVAIRRSDRIRRVGPNIVRSIGR